MDMDFATSCPLVRPVLPHIRFLFVRSRFRSNFPSDGPSRFRTCASLVLHLHQVAQGIFTPKLLDMPSTQECQLDLFADRTSAATMRVNQLRLWFASLAYVLMCALRRIGLAHTRLCCMDPGMVAGGRMATHSEAHSAP